MSAGAVGLIAEGRLLTRRGARPGDRLFASGPLGLGGAFAFARLMQPHAAPPPFQPESGLAEGQIVRHHATGCMDTSDGPIAALNELSRINEVGFALEPLECILHPAASAAARTASLPVWFMLAGPHGEFELLFTIPEPAVAAFRAEARAANWEPKPIGMVIAEPEIRIPAVGGVARLDTRAVRDAYAAAAGDPRTYLARLVAINAAMTVGDTP